MSMRNLTMMLLIIIECAQYTRSREAVRRIPHIRTLWRSEQKRRFWMQLRCQRHLRHGTRLYLPGKKQILPPAMNWKEKLIMDRTARLQIFRLALGLIQTCR